MLGILAIDEIREKYNKSPKGWYYLLGIDKTGKFLEIIPKNQNMWIISRSNPNAPYSEAIYNNFKLKQPLESTIKAKEFGVRYLDSKIDKFDDESIDKILKGTEPEKFSGIKDKDILLGPIYSPFLKSEGYRTKTSTLYGRKIHIVSEKTIIVLDVSACAETFKDMSKMVDKIDEKNKVGPMFG